MCDEACGLKLSESGINAAMLGSPKMLPEVGQPQRQVVAATRCRVDSGQQNVMERVYLHYVDIDIMPARP